MIIIRIIDKTIDWMAFIIARCGFGFREVREVIPYG